MQQVNWQQRVSTYWVRFIHVELLGFPPALPTPVSIKVADKVRVKPTVSTPRYKWGYVTHDSIGTVTCKFEFLNVCLRATVQILQRLHPMVMILLWIFQNNLIGPD